jgi:hypothetical protein
MPQQFTFLDATPGKSSIRTQELINAKARAHAAKVSHPNNRKIAQLSNTKRQPEPSVIKKENDSDEDNKAKILKQRPGTRFQHYIPKHKGNTDPFNCAAVAFSAFEYSVAKWARSVQIVTAWPSDVTIRPGNMPKMLKAGRDAIGNLVDDPATIHAFVAYSCTLRYAMNRRATSPELDTQLMQLGMKHLNLASTDLQNLIKTQMATKSSKDLENVRNAAVWLGASNIYMGKWRPSVAYQVPQ